MDKTKKSKMRRKQLLDMALSVFVEKGYHDTNVSDITGRLDLGHGTFYRYFENKQDAFYAVLAHIGKNTLKILREESPDNAKTKEEFTEQCIRLSDKLFDYFISDERNGRFMFFEVLTLSPKIRSNAYKSLELVTHFTQLYIENGQQKGFIDKELDSKISARVFNSVILEIGRQLIYSNNPEEQRPYIVRNCVEILTNGVFGASRESQQFLSNIQAETS